MGIFMLWLFLPKFMGITRRGILKELEICDFDKNNLVSISMR